MGKFNYLTGLSLLLTLSLVISSAWSIDDSDDFNKVEKPKVAYSDMQGWCAQFCGPILQAQCTTTATATTTPTAATTVVPEALIYAPMDEIIGNTSPAKGATVIIYGSPGPRSVPGKIGRAIYLPNTGTMDDNYINIGRFTDRCVDNFFLCDQGLTVSLWYKLSFTHEWPAIMTGSFWEIHTQDFGAENIPYLHYYKRDGKRYTAGGSMRVSNDQWHHVAMVYTSLEDIDIYVDGELATSYLAYNRDQNIIEKNVQVGCHGRGNCAKGGFDDLRIWETALSGDDIKKIYNQNL